MPNPIEAIRQNTQCTHYLDMFMGNGFILITTNPTSVPIDIATLIDHIVLNNHPQTTHIAGTVITDMSDHYIMSSSSMQTQMIIEMHPNE